MGFEHSPHTHRYNSYYYVINGVGVAACCEKEQHGWNAIVCATSARNAIVKACRGTSGVSAAAVTRLVGDLFTHFEVRPSFARLHHGMPYKQVYVFLPPTHHTHRNSFGNMTENEPWTDAMRRLQGNPVILVGSESTTLLTATTPSSGH